MPIKNTTVAKMQFVLILLVVLRVHVMMDIMEMVIRVLISMNALNPLPEVDLKVMIVVKMPIVSILMVVTTVFVEPVLVVMGLSVRILTNVMLAYINAALILFALTPLVRILVHVNLGPLLPDWSPELAHANAANTVQCLLPLVQRALFCVLGLNCYDFSTGK